MDTIEGVALVLAAVGEEHLFTSFLSSPGSVRNLFVATGKDVEGIRTDLNIALGLAIVFSLVVGWLLKSKLAAWGGTIFGVVLYALYKERAQL